ncbi:uncharacterized protein LOC111780598 isoform X1 [Cucurbita pepo subsp. pepo]|uniref:uncharacterized protein LOC111780598 isoform X1 n=1 Tax=Cucurbita pepo subsp. pepo TaxID=3664 RepID=UPI000C9D6B55|nr:uncharacterized protein LOC111780598 isoform X1 [Cucurbita pepo subsp. pepo]
MGIIRYFRVVIFRRGFNYHHAEAGYAMLTFWIPDLSSMLSSDSSHHFGAAAFLINDNKEVRVPPTLPNSVLLSVSKSKRRNKTEFDLLYKTVGVCSSSSSSSSSRFRHCHLVAF